MGFEHIAWVESPLQMIGTAELAEAIGIPVRLAFRLSGPQMTVTAEELIRRGALFSDPEPYAGIPWARLQEHRSWAVGDAFSGQFRLAATLRPPRELTVLDDGDMIVHLARVLAGEADFGRHGQEEGALARWLGISAHSRLLRLAARGRLELFSAFAAAPELRALAERGIRVRPHGFPWLRAHARPIELPSDRVVLGTALVADGRLDPERYLAWVRGATLAGPVAYLPHRRETVGLVERIGRLSGVSVVETRLPVELALAGTPRPLDVLAYRSSASRTLEHILAGTGSRLRSAVPELGRPAR